MACQKVCKQGRDDIIVKVNLQSLIPTSFYITVAFTHQQDVNRRFVMLKVKCYTLVCSTSPSGGRGAGISIHNYVSSKRCMPPDPSSRHTCILHATIILLLVILFPSHLKILYETLHITLHDLIESNDYALIEHASCLYHSAHVHNYSYFNSV